MGIGDFLGSISPAFGLATGKGLIGQARGPLAKSGMFGLGGLLSSLLGGHQHNQAQAPQPMAPQGPSAAQMLPGTNLPVPQAPASVPDTLGATAASLPGMAGGGNPLAMIGSALQGSQKQDQGAMQFDPNFGLMPQSSGLGQIIAQLLAS